MPRNSEVIRKKTLQLPIAPDMGTFGRQSLKHDACAAGQYPMSEDEPFDWTIDGAKKWALREFRKEWPVMKRAKFGIVALVVLTAVAVWAIKSFFISQEVSTLERDNQFLRDQLSSKAPSKPESSSETKNQMYLSDSQRLCLIDNFKDKAKEFPEFVLSSFQDEESKKYAIEFQYVFARVDINTLVPPS